jgi:hypothetical protein
MSVLKVFSAEPFWTHNAVRRTKNKDEEPQTWKERIKEWFSYGIQNRANTEKIQHFICRI